MSKQEIVATAIERMTGMDAFLTGVAVSNLIDWSPRDELEQAKAAIEALILRLKA